MYNQISLASSRYRIVAGYGSPEVSDTKPGEDVVLSTEFPSVKNAQVSSICLSTNRNIKK